MEIIVTGCSSGIGRAAALRLAQRGHRVLAGVRDLADAPRHAGIEPVRLDVTDPEQVAAVARACPGLGALVNNAGTTLMGPLEHLPPERLREQLEVNTVGVLAMTQAVLPALRSSGGRVVTVSSVGGLVVTPMLGAYSASKFAVEALMDALRREVGPSGVSVVLVEPGMVRTDNHAKTAEQVAHDREGWSPAARERYGPMADGYLANVQRLLARGSTPEQVAQVVERALTVARPRARYLTGGGARTAAAMARLLPDRVMDAAMAQSVRAPAA